MTAQLPIYLDHAATAPLDGRVAAIMSECLADPAMQANPSSAHGAGRAVAARIELARVQVARLINAPPESIVFTSGATESVNLAVLGAARGAQAGERHIVSSRIEHRAGLDACRQLEREGFAVTWLAPSPEGRIEAEQVAKAIRADTALVSLMHANNETGVLTDIEAVATNCRERGILFHTDAAQSAGKLAIDVESMGVALLSFCAHKLGGPKGVGALYVRRRPRPALHPLLFGGGHERGLRSGTLAQHQIIGFGAACALSSATRADESDSRTLASRTAVGGPSVRSADLAKRRRRSLDSRNPERRLCGSRRRKPVARTGRQARRVERIRMQFGDERAFLRAACARPFRRGNTGLIALESRTIDDGERRRSGRGDPGPGRRAPSRGAAGGRAGAHRMNTAASHYSPRVLALFAELPGAGSLPAGGGAVVAGEAVALDRGAWVRFEARLEHGRIADCRFRAWGCPHTLAAAAFVAAELRGRTQAGSHGIDASRLARELAAPAEKMGRFLVVEDALRALLADGRRVQ